MLWSVIIVALRSWGNLGFMLKTAERIFDNQLVHIKKHDVIAQKKCFQDQRHPEPSKLEILFYAVIFIEENWYIRVIDILTAKLIYTEIWCVLLQKQS